MQEANQVQVKPVGEEIRSFQDGMSHTYMHTCLVQMLKSSAPISIYNFIPDLSVPHPINRKHVVS